MSTTYEMTLTGFTRTAATYLSTARPGQFGASFPTADLGPGAPPGTILVTVRTPPSAPAAIPVPIMTAVPKTRQVPYQVAGPMGRAYLRLPCNHQDVSLAGERSDGSYGPATRSCTTCKIRYTITIKPGQDTAWVAREN
jgi:hypothetical protein